MITLHSLRAPMLAVMLAGCTSTSFQNALGTPKNPTPIFSNPVAEKGKASSEDAIIVPLYNVLLESNVRANNNRTLKTVGSDNIRRYIAAGFALSDIYCSRFFAKTDEAYRRRRFGRTLTNDVGTAVSTLLGLASAGENIVTGVAAGVGLADSAWRNYDDSFVVSPDLSNVQSLVFAAQDNYRARTLAKDSTLPGDYASAQTAILRYANLCSFLGMKGLLDQSAGEQRLKLNKSTEEVNDPPKTAQDGGGTAPNQKGGKPAPAATEESAPLPATAPPPVSANKPEG